jgi:copper chaperone
MSQEVPMQKETLNIPNISCGHCVAAIEKELKSISGVSAVNGNSDTKEVEVQWKSPATLDIIKRALADINYPVA